MTMTTTETVTTVTALIDPKAPAKASYDPHGSLIRQGYDAKLREPAFVDGDGDTMWAHPDGIEYGFVTVPATTLRTFRAYMRVLGLMRIEPGTYQIHGVADTWENLRTIVGR